MTLKHIIGQRIGAGLAKVLPPSVSLAFARRLSDSQPQLLLEALGPRLNRNPVLDTMPFDLPISRPLQFEDLAGLFASTSLDHGVIAMTVRQTAYIFGLVRRMNARKVIEVGRYKGGSTLVIAAERDTFTPPAIAEGMASAIPGADFLMLRAGSHAAPVKLTWPQATPSSAAVATGTTVTPGASSGTT